MARGLLILIRLSSAAALLPGPGQRDRLIRAGRVVEDRHRRGFGTRALWIKDHFDFALLLGSELYTVRCSR